jgi:hypothetical protein
MSSLGEGCCDEVCCDEVCERGIVEIVELVVKHEGKLRKLVKALKNLCCRATSPTESELMDKMNNLVDSTVVWGSREKKTWKKLAKQLVRAGSWISETAEDYPWD